MKKEITHRKSWLRFIWVIPILMLIAAAIPKSIGVETMIAEAERTGLIHTLLPSAFIELACAIVFLIPSTRRIGFLLCVSYIGGIIATRWIVQEFNMGIPMQVLLWIGMYFEDKELFHIKPKNSKTNGVGHTQNKNYE